jgi:hypothetical protein
MDKISSLGMPMSSQEISKRYKHQSLGMPPRNPFFIGKNPEVGLLVIDIVGLLLFG